jgi:hypothetical protein
MKIYFIILGLLLGNTCLAFPPMGKRLKDPKETTSFAVPINRSLEILKAIGHTASALTLIGAAGYFIFLTSHQKNNPLFTRSPLLLALAVAGVTLVKDAFLDAEQALESFRKVFLGYNPNSVPQFLRGKVKTQEFVV